MLEYRLRNEYNVEIKIRNLPYNLARWIVTDNFNKDMLAYTDTLLLEDQYQRPVVLFKNEWSLSRMEDKNKDVKFLDIAPVN